MKLTRLVLFAAAAAGATYWFKDRGRGPGGLSDGPRRRLDLGGGLGAAGPASSPVAETMWTPADPADVPIATGGPAVPR